jgi:hypothetical protein
MGDKVSGDATPQKESYDYQTENDQAAISAYHEGGKEGDKEHPS